MIWIWRIPVYRKGPAFSARWVSAITVLGSFHKSHLHFLAFLYIFWPCMYPSFSVVLLNLHETDLLFRYLSHHLTWHCSSISEDLHRFARNLQHMNAKLFLLLFLGVASLKLFRINNKNNFAFIYCKFLVNLCKYLLRNSTFFQTTTAFLKPIWKDIQEKILIWSYFFIDLTLEF